MTTGGCAEVRLSLGAYVLGALDPGERSRVDAHVAGCAACRDELASLAAMPGLLGRVSREEVEAVPLPPQPELLDRLLAAAASERRRDRRVRWLASVAAAIVLLAAGGVAVGFAVTGHNSNTALATPAAAGVKTVTATDASTGVTASVVETPKAWGAALHVKVTGTKLAAYGGRCHLVAISADGDQDVAASWSALPSGHISADGATAFMADEITWFRIVGSDGATLVSVPAT